MTTPLAVKCPKCGSLDLYDNRAENDQRLARGEKLRPDYKCKDKACDGAVWRPKNGARPAPKSEPQPYSAGPQLPGETDAAPQGQRDLLFAFYTACYDHAFSIAKRTWGNDASDTAVAAMAATLFIQGSERGVIQ